MQETDSSKVDLLKVVKATSSNSRVSSNLPHTVTVVATTNSSKVKVVTASNLLQVVIHMLRKSIDELKQEQN